MFIHTITFLNISKSSPTKTYLAYLILNHGVIIQFSCSPSSLRMQYLMPLTSLCLSILLSPSVSVPPFSLYFIVYIFMQPVPFSLLMYWISNSSLLLLLPLQSALLFSGFLSFRRPCLCRLIPEGSQMISAVILPSPSLHLQLACSQLYFFFNLFKLPWGYCHTLFCLVKIRTQETAQNRWITPMKWCETLL